VLVELFLVKQVIGRLFVVALDILDMLVADLPDPLLASVLADIRDLMHVVRTHGRQFGKAAQLLARQHHILHRCDGLGDQPDKPLALVFRQLDLRPHDQFPDGLAQQAVQLALDRFDGGNCLGILAAKVAGIHPERACGAVILAQPQNAVGLAGP